MFVYERKRAAFIPEGGSKIITCEALISVAGTFGLFSIVKKSLKFGSSYML